MSSLCKKISFLLLFASTFILVQTQTKAQKVEIIKVGSKKFTENVILGEIITQLLQADSIKATHIKELGGTTILWNALLNGEVDIYPDYTGTILKEILAKENLSASQLESFLKDKGIGVTKPLGFNNTYAIGLKKETAEKLNINFISDLASHPELKFGFTNEFMDRNDGWPGLRNAYQLNNKATGLDHDLAYKGLESGAIDVIDLYSTDAEISYYNLKVLKDDKNYFADYKAVYLYREEITQKYPEINKIFSEFENSIPESLMIKMNSEVKINKLSEASVASEFIRNKFSIKTDFSKSTFYSRLLRNTFDHLFLVCISLAMAISLAIPLGIISYKVKKLGKIILGITGVIQTIPSLALLVFMIPLLGIGPWPAIAALFLYSLLPIVRNTYSGLQNIPGSIKESAVVLGLPGFAILKKIELPIASPSILSGIKISAVINVGTATLGALIGAGGYGQPILTGIRLDSISLILEGAIPAAVLALLVQGLFDLLEKILVPRGLKL
jgi:glycine betaine/choline ABC-type transport system substrate-binding protein/ABC-type proline/glycine betaine transport system permease subunit